MRDEITHEIYCGECGSNDVEFLWTCFDGDIYKCRNCGEEFVEPFEDEDEDY